MSNEILKTQDMRIAQRIIELLGSMQIDKSVMDECIDWFNSIQFAPNGNLQCVENMKGHASSDDIKKCNDLAMGKYKKTVEMFMFYGLEHKLSSNEAKTHIRNVRAEEFLSKPISEFF